MSSRCRYVVCYVVCAELRDRERERERERDRERGRERERDLVSVDRIVFTCADARAMVVALGPGLAQGACTCGHAGRRLGANG